MLVRPQHEYASEVWNPYTMKCILKIEQIQRNSCRFIFHDYRRDSDTSFLINRLNLDSLYIRRLIQQATMFYNILCNLVDICHTSYAQHADHISSRTDHPVKYCTRNPSHINAYKYSILPCSINIWNHLPCSSVFLVTTFVDNFHKSAMPAITVMQPLYGAALILISYEGHVFLPIVNNSVLFKSYSCNFLIVVVFVFLHSSISV